MAIQNVGIKGYNGLPFVDEVARGMIENVGITNKFDSKKWAIFGDSISQPESLDSLSKYYNIIADKLNMTTTSYAVGGTGYFKGNDAGYGTGNIVDKINNANTDFDIISLMAGVNEHTLTLGDITDGVVDTPTTLCGAVKKSIEMAIEKYPNSQIFMITSTPGKYAFNSISQGTLNEYVNKQIEIAKIYNIPVLDLFHESNLRPWNDNNAEKYYKDHLHLNATGHQYIAQIIQNFMNLKLSL